MLIGWETKGVEMEQMGISGASLPQSESSEVISDLMFGDIYTGFTTISNYFEEGSDYNNGVIRWPGGSVSESKMPDLLNFSLTADELLWSDVKDVSDRGLIAMLETAIEMGRDLNFILPTLPYFSQTGGQDSLEINNALANYSADLGFFFDRLLTSDGYYDLALDYIEQGSQFLLEIGNETAHLGWADHSYNSDWNYGELAYHALSVATEETSQNSDAFKFGIQIGLNVGSSKKIIAELNGTNDGKENILGEIDMLISHHGLTLSSSAFDYTKEYKIIQEWVEAFAEDGDETTNFSDVDLYASAWSVGSSSEGMDIITNDGTLKGIEDFHSEDMSLADQQKEYEAYLDFLSSLSEIDCGARQGASTLDVFAKLVSLGFDQAALWGTVDPSNHLNSYQLDSREGNWYGTGEGNDFALSFGGEVLRMLSERITGTHLLDGGAVADNSDPENWNATYYDWDTQSGAGAINSYYFANGSKCVIVSSVTDIDGYWSTNGGSLTNSYDISNLGSVNFVTVEAIRTTFDTAGWRAFVEANGNHEFFDMHSDDIREFRRLFETPEVVTQTIAVDSDGTFEYEFTSDFEVVSFSFETTAFSEGFIDLDIDQPASTSEEINVISGTVVDDIVHGTNEDDYITGLDGADNLKGENGNDILDGGTGVDRLAGGNGEDCFVFSENSDLEIVYDFADGEDLICLSGMNYEELSIETYRGQDTLISFDDVWLILRNVDASKINQDDFVYETDLLIA